MSGRVVLDNEPIQNYELYEGEMQTRFQNSLQGIQDKSVLSKAFLPKNIDCIQRNIQKKILQKQIIE